ncbi:MAG TPA: hypothetical protein VHI98_19235 [Vicinamibacterales bacterium]|nr:hypothetical protein [Vicinamibacterales bacterium]
MILVAMLALAMMTQQPVPRPFPKPGETPPPAPAPQPPTRPAPVAPQKPVTAPSETAPTQETLGLPVYPGAQFLASYDAGRGQRYYLFGTNATFAEIVAYYKTYLKDGGERVYDEPPVHLWEVGRYKEETMAYPPGITVKDYAWGGSKGWLNTKPNANPARFVTIIQIVPAPR